MKGVIFKKNGMSILEVVFSMVIFSMGLLGIIGMLTLGREGVEFGNKITLAITLAQEKFEEKWSAFQNDLLWDDLDGDGWTETKMNDDGNGVFINQDEPQSGWIRKWSIKNNTDLTLIEVETIWQDKYQKEHSVRLRGLRGP